MNLYPGVTIAIDQVTYKIFAVVETIGVIKDNSSPYAFINTENSQEFIDYVNGIKEKALIKSDIEVGGDDKLIALSTCSYHRKDGRLLVYGLRIPNE